MFSRRDMLAATAVGGAVTAATMTTANATPVKSDISFGNPNDPPQGAITPRIQGASAIPVRRIRPSGTSFPAHFLRRRPTSAACR
jgi:hypothetical protein